MSAWHDSGVTLLQILVIFLVIGAAAAVIAGVVTGGLAPRTSSVPPLELPDRDLTSADLEQVTFTQALRGYRMAEVDALLDRLQQQLERAADPEPAPQIPAELPRTADRTAELPPLAGE